MNKTRVVFFGTPEFAIPILEALVEASYQIVAVVTAPDEPAGRKQSIVASPVKQYALKNKLTVLQPNTLIDFENPEADIAIIAAYGKLLPISLLEGYRLGVLNVHPSLLPHYRGPSPIRGALLNGDTETGVTIMLTDEKMDHGPILSQEKVQIHEEDDAVSLTKHLAKYAAHLLIKTLPSWIKGTLKPKEQDHNRATFTKLVRKEDGRINWRQSAPAILQHIRAYAGWPSSWSVLTGGGKEVRIKIIGAQTWGKKKLVATPGLVVESKKEFCVACVDSVLEILELQPEGKQIMTAKEFLRGITFDQNSYFS